MDLRSATKAVYAHFLAAWAIGPNTPVALGNESMPEPAAPWVRVTMIPNTDEQLTVGGTGNKVFERHDAIMVGIFSPADAGDGPLLDLMQAAVNVFEGKSTSSGGETINFFRVRRSRGDDETHLITALVEAQCRYQERK